MQRRLCVFLAVGAAIGMTGCGGQEPVRADEIAKLAETDNQTAPAGARLPLALAVQATTAGGTTIPREPIRWRLVGDRGVLSDSVTVSDGTGRAQVEYTLPDEPGAYRIDAALFHRRERMVSFVATATAAPQLTGLSPAQFTGGDVVTLQGNGLSLTAVVDVSGSPARVVTGTATQLSVVVPICLPPGPVNFRVRVSGALSNTRQGTFVAPASPPVNLAVGEYAQIDPGQLAAGCATFPSAGVLGAEYLLAPQGVNAGPGVSTAYRLVGDSTVALTVSAVPAPPEESAADAFHRFLRTRERELSLAPNRPGPLAAAPAAAAAAISVGDRRSFQVCNKFGCNPLPDFTRVDAVVKYVGDHLVIFLDEKAPSGGFTDAEFQALGDGFDDVLYDVNTRAFGVESDIDRNGYVYVLLTPVVNAITPREQCNTSVVTGFFFGIDLDPTFAADVRANQAEIFYAFAPDPSGTVTCTISKSQVQRLVPSTFIHEFQHMISYNQHVLIRRAPAEDVWLNEAMSHLAEELGGNKYRDMGQQQTYSDFAISNVFNAFTYLKAPGAHALLFPLATAGTLSERGSGWLFLRWVVDQFGVATLRRLEETRLVGGENIAAAVGEPFARLLGQWFLANWVSDLPSFTPPARLRYETWSFRATYASLNQQQPSRYDRPFPIVPQVFNGGTFTASGPGPAGSGDFFRVVQGPMQRGFAVRLTDGAGQPLGSGATMRLNVIRIR